MRYVVGTAFVGVEFRQDLLENAALLFGVLRVFVVAASDLLIELEDTLLKRFVRGGHFLQRLGCLHLIRKGVDLLEKLRRASRINVIGDAGCLA